MWLLLGMILVTGQSEAFLIDYNQAKPICNTWNLYTANFIEIVRTASEIPEKKNAS